MINLRIKSEIEGNEIISNASGKYLGHGVFYTSKSPDKIPSVVKLLIQANADYALNQTNRKSEMRVTIE